MMIMMMVMIMMIMMMMVMRIREKERRLDAEHQTTDEETAERDLPCADPQSQDQSGEEQCPERLREDDGEGVPQRHVEDTGELEQYSQSSDQSLQQNQELVQPSQGQEGSLYQN